jgi:hypothetical protein
MPAAIPRTIARGLALLQIESGNPTFTLNGTEVPCVVNSLMRGIAIEIGGLSQEISLSLFVLPEDMPPGPIEGQRLTFNGVVYRVLTSKLTASQSHYELHLGDPDSARQYFPTH